MYNIAFVKTYMQIYAKKYRDIAILFMFLVIIYLSFESITLLVLLFIKLVQKLKSHFRLSSGICSESL